MSDERDGRAWVVQPPDAGEISLFVAVGDGVELSEQQQDALGQLLRTLEEADAEVVGLDQAGDCPKRGSDCTLTCGTVICKDLVCWTLKAAAQSAPGWTIAGTFGTLK